MIVFHLAFVVGLRGITETVGGKGVIEPVLT